MEETDHQSKDCGEEGRKEMILLYEELMMYTSMLYSDDENLVYDSAPDSSHGRCITIRLSSEYSRATGHMQPSAVSGALLADLIHGMDRIPRLDSTHVRSVQWHDRLTETRPAHNYIFRCGQ